MNMYTEIHEKLEFLLRDHGVEFDDSHLDKQTLHSFHVKADELLKAHKCTILEGDDSVTALQPKLDMLISGHGKTFDDFGLNPESLDTVIEKLNILVGAHGKYS
ncbi:MULTISPECIES: hypothetical protein [Enterococcus]|uniref:hypothetical protein n=1 Tax=Enterococcaceae TaxID=81852 RepID=UPI000CF1C7B5|nr:MULTISPECIES: hypothetical protein [Enterococcus]PQF01880.1 hypothetical protein CUS95_11025 [Enterococcus faecium]PQF18182.1 hypothetical protein CUS93_14720 [Enterococcus faecium]PQG60179.1 hypothetical protein CUS28_12105 [Enterococcus faecium]